MPLLYLVYVAYGLVVLAAPFLGIALFVRQARLRKQLNELAEENAKQHTKLQRAVGELQAKLASTPFATASAAEKPVTAEGPSHVPVPGSYPQVPIYPPVVVSSRIEVQPPIEPQPTRSVSPAAAPPQDLLAPPVPLVPKPLEPKPVAPAPQAPPLGAEPTPPPAPTPPRVVPPPAARHTPTTPVTPPSQPTATPPAATGRISTPSPFSPLRTPAPRPTMKDRMKAISALEDTLGTNWFAKLGGIMVVIGLTTLALIKLQSFGAAGKAIVSYLVAFLFLGGGIFLEKRERYQLLGRIGIGCGWALLFGSTYGIHNFPAMRILDSLVVDCILMLIIALGMAVHTLRYKSQLVTGLSFLLGYTTVALSFSEITSVSSASANESTVYGLLAGVILAIGLVTIVLKMGWFELEVFGILSSYLNHLYWLYKILGPNGAHGRLFPEYHASLAMLFFYWLTFRISYILRSVKTDLEEHISTVSALLNTLLLLGVMKFQSVDPDLAYIALLLIGALEFIFAQLPISRRRRAFVVLSLLGAALMIVSVPSHFSGNPVAYLWLVGAEVFLFAGIIFEEVVFLRVGLFTGLLVGIDLIGFNFRPLVMLRAKSENLALEAGILFAVCGVALYLNALYVGSRWKESFRTALDRRLLDIHSYVGAFATATAAWALFASDWTAVAFAAIMLALAAIGRRLDSRHLQIQYALLGALTLYRVLVFNLHINAPSHEHITTRLVTLPILGVIFYLTAKLAALRDDQEQRVFRALFSFAGASMFGFLIWAEAPPIWMAALFLAAGIILALIGRRWSLPHLGFQEHLFAIAAIARIFDYNYHLTTYYGNLSVRMVTVSIVAAGLYAISRKATVPDAPYALSSAYLHTTAATSLLALLMWYEFSTGSGWLAAFWALFAFVLAAVDRRFRFDDLRSQAHALAALTMIRAVGINMHVEETWHGVSIRLLSLSIVAVVFYVMSRLTRMPDEWRARDFHHIYSWCASLIVSLLLWHELKPLSIAVGLAAFGLVLFEYGLLRKIAQFRYQSYVAFTAAFARIFFANLAAGDPGVFLSDRMITVVPLILIFFFVYAQLPAQEENTTRDRAFHFDAFVAYLGTATIAALFYFQFPPEWVVTAYAAVALALFTAAWALNRPIFLHQGILLTLATFARGMAHNLFGSSYFDQGTWQGRYSVVGTASAILLASLYFAFAIRGRYAPPVNASRWKKITSALVARPEQLQFFIPVILVATMFALKMKAEWVTASWGLEGLCIVLLAYAVKEHSFRLTGYAMLVLCVAKVAAMDFWRETLFERGISVAVVGSVLLAVALLHTRLKEIFEQRR
ncbi:MAG: DUF2339 domain-containing protein [Candidatus Acidiferrum sp.]